MAPLIRHKRSSPNSYSQLSIAASTTQCELSFSCLYPCRRRSHAFHFHLLSPSRLVSGSASPSTSLTEVLSGAQTSSFTSIGIRAGPLWRCFSVTATATRSIFSWLSLPKIGSGPATRRLDVLLTFGYDLMRKYGKYCDAFNGLSGRERNKLNIQNNRIWAALLRTELFYPMSTRCSACAFALRP